MVDFEALKQKRLDEKESKKETEKKPENTQRTWAQVAEECNIGKFDGEQIKLKEILGKEMLIEGSYIDKMGGYDTESIIVFGEVEGIKINAISSSKVLVKKFAKVPESKYPFYGTFVEVDLEENEYTYYDIE